MEARCTHVLMISDYREEFRIYPWFNFTDRVMRITTIAPDMYAGGGDHLLIAYNGILSTFHVNSPAQRHLIVGNTERYGYQEGIGSAAIFTLISGFVQMNSAEVIILDQQNNMIRSLSRIDNSTSRLIGSRNCTSFIYDGYFESSCVYHPLAIVKYSSDVLYIVDNLINRILRKLELTERMIETLVVIPQILALNIDRNLQLLYAVGETEFFLAQPGVKNTKYNYFSNDELDDLTEIAVLSDSNTILLANKHSLYMADISTRTVSSVCNMTSDGYISDGADECYRFSGRINTILQWNSSTVFIGTSEGMLYTLEGKCHTGT